MGFHKHGDCFRPLGSLFFQMAFHFMAFKIRGDPKLLTSLLEPLSSGHGSPSPRKVATCARRRGFVSGIQCGAYFNQMLRFLKFERLNGWAF